MRLCVNRHYSSLCLVVEGAALHALFSGPETLDTKYYPYFKAIENNMPIPISFNMLYDSSNNDESIRFLWTGYVLPISKHCHLY